MITEQEVLSLLNQALRKTGNHQNHYFDSIVKLRIEDRTGCNWAYANLTGSNGTSNLCPPEAGKIVTRVRAEYNLK